jgi:uncharacterized protein (DUF427 family)
MSTRARELMMRGFGELRHEPTEKRVRATVGGETLVDSTRAMLVWEPRRIVPSYAVPADDIKAALEPAEGGGPPPDGVLHPGIPFALHSSEGEPVTLGAGANGERPSGFRLADPDLDGYVLLDFPGFEAWYEEDEEIISHPRDPFHRVDVRRSSRHVRVELGGVLLAESSTPTLVFETNLPVRFYLPRADLRAEAAPSAKRTRCPYKGEALHWSFPAAGTNATDLAWSYDEPLPDAIELAGLVAFYDERVDITLDGRSRERPRTEFSRALLEEVGRA